MTITRSESLLAVVAGSDTTATTITTIWYFLMLDPGAFDRLRGEIDEQFPSGEEPLDFTRMANMPYLNACMYVLDSTTVLRLTILPI